MKLPSPINILIVDDENLARERIKRLLKTFHLDHKIYEAENVPTAITQIRDIKPQILLLDIQMPVMSGFDLLHQLEERPFAIIFQTAYDEFAIKAFEESACDYLLKPFAEERLHHALNKAINLLQSPQHIENLAKHLVQSNLFLNSILTKIGTATKILRISDIVAFKSEDHYTFAITEAGDEYVVDNSLQWLEQKLDPSLFIRCHRNNIIQINYIDKVGGTEDSFIYLKNRIKLPLSRENRKKLKEIFLPQ